MSLWTSAASECSQESYVIGIFNTELVAEMALIDHAKRQKADWHGQHHFELVEVPLTSELYSVKYDGDWEERGQHPRLRTREIEADDTVEAQT